MNKEQIKHQITISKDLFKVYDNLQEALWMLNDERIAQPHMYPEGYDEYLQEEIEHATNHSDFYYNRVDRLLSELNKVIKEK